MISGRHPVSRRHVDGNTVARANRIDREEEIRRSSDRAHTRTSPPYESARKREVAKR